MPIRKQAYRKRSVNSSFPFVQFSKALNLFGKKEKATPTLLPLNFNALILRRDSYFLVNSNLVGSFGKPKGSLNLQGIPKILHTQRRQVEKIMQFEHKIPFNDFYSYHLMHGIHMNS